MASVACAGGSPYPHSWIACTAIGRRGEELQNQCISGGREERKETDAMIADSVRESLSGEEWAEVMCLRITSRPSMEPGVGLIRKRSRHERPLEREVDGLDRGKMEESSRIQ